MVGSRGKCNRMQRVSHHSRATQKELYSDENEKLDVILTQGRTVSLNRSKYIPQQWICKASTVQGALTVSSRLGKLSPVSKSHFDVPVKSFMEATFVGPIICSSVKKMCFGLNNYRRNVYYFMRKISLLQVKVHRSLLDVLCIQLQLVSKSYNVVL